MIFRDFVTIFFVMVGITATAIGIHEAVHLFEIKFGEDNVDDLVAGVEGVGANVLKMSKIRRGVEFGDLFTLKQREILEPTIELGYYDFPRKISLNDLSKKVGVSPSTLCVHLQKIESRVFWSDLRFF